MKFYDIHGAIIDLKDCKTNTKYFTLDKIKPVRIFLRLSTKYFMEV